MDKENFKFLLWPHLICHIKYNSIWSEGNSWMCPSDAFGGSPSCGWGFLGLGGCSLLPCSTLVPMSAWAPLGGRLEVWSAIYLTDCSCRSSSCDTANQWMELISPNGTFGDCQTSLASQRATRIQRALYPRPWFLCLSLGGCLVSGPTPGLEGVLECSGGMKYNFKSKLIWFRKTKLRSKFIAVRFQRIHSFIFQITLFVFSSFFLKSNFSSRPIQIEILIIQNQLLVAFLSPWNLPGTVRASGPFTVCLSCWTGQKKKERRRKRRKSFGSFLMMSKCFEFRCKMRKELKKKEWHRESWGRCLTLRTSSLQRTYTQLCKVALSSLSPRWHTVLQARKC